MITYILLESLKPTAVALPKAWVEELDFKIAMRRRGRAAGASLKEMAKKYGF
jgi:hypothetical protein